MHQIVIDFVHETDDLASEVEAWRAEFAPRLETEITGQPAWAGSQWPGVILRADLGEGEDADEDAVMDALVEYCGGDIEHALDMFQDSIFIPSRRR